MQVLADDPRAFYEGPLAERIVATVIAEGGRLSPEDLLDHQSEWTVPVARDFEGWRVEEFPPNSQGWLTLLTLGVAVGAGGMRRGAARTHRLIEAAQIARSVRDNVLADATSMRNPADWYLDPARIARLSELVSTRPGAFVDVHRVLGDAARASMPTGHGDTAHFAVVDADGLATSCIQSVYSDFGTGIVVPGTGIVLQNRGWAFSLQPEHPNVLAPRKRPSHTLAPALATRDGETIAAFGCMGGDAQTQVHCQLLVGLVVDGRDPASAIAAPRWFTRPVGPGYEVLVEHGHAHARALGDLGHATVAVRRYEEAMGHAQIILRDPQSGVLCGAADPRSDGMALGF